MPFEYEHDCALLLGSVTADDAEVLSQWLQLQDAPSIDLGGCEHLHGAALQVLLALRPRVLVPPLDPFLASVLQGA